jgi:uncharacterized protein (DUF983 family)
MPLAGPAATAQALGKLGDRRLIRRVCSRPDFRSTGLKKSSMKPIARRTLYFRALCLRCLRCGKGPLFRGWFRMVERCPECGFVYERDPGYFLGSIYLNYGLTALLVTFGYLGLWLGDVLPQEQIFWLVLAFSVLFPILFFRWARSLWMAFDHALDPPAAMSDAAGPMQREEKSVD